MLFDPPERPGGNTVVYRHDDSLWHFVDVIEGPEGWESAVLYLLRSHDGGETWTEAQVFDEEFGIMVRHAPIQLSGGRLLLPAYDEKVWRGFAFITDDEGDTWRRSGWMVAEAGCIQPTIIERSDGTLHATRMLGWPGGDNLEEALTRATGLPVSVANDVHGLTQHAQWFGPLKGFRDAVLITLGQGIGVGAVVDDELLIGDQGAASILGRLWSPEGELFGDLLSIEALEARAREAGVGDAQFPALLADPAAQEAVDFTVRTLGQLARAAAIAYAPRRILLTGEAIRILDGRMGLVEAELGRDWRDDLDQPELVVEPLEVSAFAVGAAGLAVRSLFLPS